MVNYVSRGLKLEPGLEYSLYYLNDRVIILIA